jgi:hypothetical protein
MEVIVERDESGAITGARSADNRFSLDLGGNALTLSADEGGSLFSIDAAGNAAFSGRATFELAGQTLDLSEIDLTVGRDEEGNRQFALNGQLDTTPGVPGGGADFSASFNESGTVTARLGLETIEEMAQGLDRVTGFLDRVGVEVDSGGGLEVSVNTREQSFAVDINGLNVSFNAEEQEFSFGGLSIGAGISAEIENVTVNARTGRVSGQINAGVGVGVTGAEIGVDLAGFGFEFNPEDNDAITLTGTVGITAANLEVEARLTRDPGSGQYGVDSVTFTPQVDDALARDVAAGLNTAYAAGTDVGRQALAQGRAVAGEGREALQNFGRGLSAAGNQTRAFLEETASLAGDDLTNFLKAAGGAGGAFGALMESVGQLDGDNLSHFLSAAASQGSGFLSSFNSLLSDVNALAGGVAGLKVDRNGLITGRINVGGAGQASVTFGHQGGKLAAVGSLSIGGFQFAGATMTFNTSGMLDSVSGSARFKTPGFRVFGKKIGGQSLTFGLSLDAGGRIRAESSFKLSLGFLGKHRFNASIGTGGISIRRG